MIRILLWLLLANQAAAQSITRVQTLEVSAPSATEGGRIRFRDAANPSHSLTILAPASFPSQTWRLPATQAAGPLCNDGLGNLTWSGCGGGGGGTGDFSTNTTTSAAGEMVVYADTTGKLGGRSLFILAGPATTAKTYTFPNQNSTMAAINNVQTWSAAQTINGGLLIVDNFGNAQHNHTNGVNGGQITDAALSAAVTVPKGGTGQTSLSAHGVLIGNGTSAVTVSSAGTSGYCFVSNGASADPTFQICPTGGGNVAVSGSTTNGNIPYWSSTGGTLHATGLAYGQAASGLSLVQRDSGGAIVIAGLTATTGTFTNIVAITPSTATTALAIRRGTLGQTDPIATFSDQSGNVLSSIDKDGKFPATMLLGTVPIANLGSSGTPSSSTFLRGDNVWATPAGAGTVTNTGTLTSGRIIKGNGGTDITVGDLTGVVTTSGGMTTSFASSSGSGAVILQTNATLASTTVLNGKFNSLYGSTSAAPVIEFLNAVGDVNYLQVQSNISGQSVYLTAAGSDANVNLTLGPKGSGKLILGAVGAVSINGGSVGQFLRTDGFGGLSWQTVSGTGTVTTIETTLPIVGGPINTSGFISCPTCVTSAAALTANRIMLGNGSQVATTMTSLGTTTQVLHGNASGVPSWGPVSLSSDVSGTLPVGNGGIGTITLTAHGVLIGNGTGAIAATTAGLAGQCLVSNGASADPTFQSCPGSGGTGDVSATGATTSGRIPFWSVTNKTLDAVGYAVSSTTNTASAIIIRDPLSAAVFFDKGGQTINVRSYGAVGDCSTNDATAIQNAINAAQTSSSGVTEVLLDGSCFAISNGLTIGNGVADTGSSAATESTRRQIIMRGQGGRGVDSARTGSTRIKWIGGSTGTELTIQGPMNPGPVLENITFDGNGGSNVTGINQINASHSYWNNISIINARLGVNMTANARGNVPYGNCDNSYYNLTISTTVSGGSGINLDGLDVGTPTDLDDPSHGGSYSNIDGHDSCSNFYFSPYIWHDGYSSTAYAVRLAYADSNTFYSPNFYGGPSDGSGLSKGVFFDNAALSGPHNYFPTANVFHRPVSHQGWSGTTGTGANSITDKQLGDCYRNCDPTTSLTSGTLPQITETGGSIKNYLGINLLGTLTTKSGGSSFTALKHVDASNTEIFSIRRGTAYMEIYSFDDVSFINSGAVRGKFKIYHGTSQPFACSGSTFEGGLWIDTTRSGTGDIVKVCAANNAGTLAWRTISTF